MKVLPSLILPRHFWSTPSSNLVIGLNLPLKPFLLYASINIPFQNNVLSHKIAILYDFNVNQYGELRSHFLVIVKCTRIETERL